MPFIVVISKHIVDNNMLPWVHSNSVRWSKHIDAGEVPRGWYLLGLKQWNLTFLL